MPVTLPFITRVDLHSSPAPLHASEMTYHACFETSEHAKSKRESSLQMVPGKLNEKSEEKESIERVFPWPSKRLSRIVSASSSTYNGVNLNSVLHMRPRSTYNSTDLNNVLHMRGPPQHREPDSVLHMRPKSAYNCADLNDELRLGRGMADNYYLDMLAT